MYAGAALPAVICANEFCMGGPYAWSVFSGPLAEDMGWEYGRVTLAYSLQPLVISVAGVLGGKLLDRFGPTVILMFSGMLWGAGGLRCLTVTSDTFGMKHMGFNYGIVFTAYGIAAIAGPMAAPAIKSSTGRYENAFSFACAISLATLVTVLILWSIAKKVGAGSEE